MNPTTTIIVNMNPVTCHGRTSVGAIQTNTNACHLDWCKAAQNLWCDEHCKVTFVAGAAPVL